MSENWVTASAPGKFVIMGEHAVVYGEPAMVLAIDRRISCSVRRNPYNTLNGESIDFNRQPHFRYLTRNLHHAMAFQTSSEIPAGSGLGSSAALSASLALALRARRNLPFDEQELVLESYNAELYAQGNGSPMDASACVHGKGVLVNMDGKGSKHLWTIARGERTWKVDEVDSPPMSFVIGNTGIRAPTGPQVDKVRRYTNRSKFARGIVEEIGSVTRDGYLALARNDAEALGRLMTRDHKLLSILGVSCKELNKLVSATLPYSYGAKLTGSGGGGCMVALTDYPEKVADIING
ncbi:MAG: mevalonate kinase, partial [Candidatus Methanomethylophilaceae archaeon]|nr:mevalonate kinase [Candidatus Methanomethylophilaceae archaeon]